MRIKNLVLGVIILLGTNIVAQNSTTDTIQDLFLVQLSLYPQEKVHTQTDKSSYFSGDTIWIRVHLVDALLLKKANASRYVYVEMINPLSKVAHRAMLRPDSLGYFYGYVNLDKALPEGNYTLRAYTKYMQNQGEDYFFRKSIYVIDPMSAIISPKVNFTFKDNKVITYIYFTQRNREDRIIPDNCSLFVDGDLKEEEKKLLFKQESSLYTFDLTKAITQPIFLLQTTHNGNTHNSFFKIPIPDSTFDVSFFPEGGHAPLQTDIQIAFKALKKNGLHENIKGTVFDDTGAVWAHFKSSHLGMGQFKMNYLPERSYHVVCTNNDNISRRFNLPLPEPNVVALKTRWRDESLSLTLSMSPNYTLPTGIRLIAHIRGAVLFSEPWGESRGFLFEKDFFPAGIIHFILIDKEKNILSERLVFSSQKSSFANVYMTPGKHTNQIREKIDLCIKVTDENEVPLSGNFSISVVDKKDVSLDTSSSIITTLLLSSELKGHIESPMNYFQNDDKKTVTALDVLMMTQGWRRYNVQEILKGNLQTKLKFPVESNRQFSGRVTGVFSALKDGNISMIAYKDSILGTSFVKTEDNGRFVFSNVDYPDSTRYLIQALRKKGSSLAFIELDSIESFPLVSHLPFMAAEKHAYDDSYLDKVNKKLDTENEMWMINLAEVEVKAKRVIRRKTESPFYSISSSFVLGIEEIEKSNFMTVFDLLRRLPGVTISGNEVFYRRATPMLILDNVPSENFDYSMLNVNDISDVFVSPATSVMPIFGSRAANGAIVINTKKGYVEKNSMNKNMQILTPIGYQQHVEFYSPVYETEEQRNNTTPDLRSTIYWNPNISTDSAGTANLTFYSADSPSHYGIIIEGISSEGHLIYSSNEVIEVK